MADSAFWKAREDEFRKYDQLYGALSALWRSDDDAWLFSDDSHKRTQLSESEDAFKALARIAAGGLPNVAQTSDKWRQWLDTLRSEKRGVVVESSSEGIGIEGGPSKRPRGAISLDIGWLVPASRTKAKAGKPAATSFSASHERIQHLFRTSANYCLDLRSRSAAPQPSATPQPSRSDLAQDKSRKRRDIVMPILDRKRWKRGRWATEAGVGKNCVYDYLAGKRNLTDDNRDAMAEALGLKPEELPE
jgi:hypothetical protein